MGEAYITRRGGMGGEGIGGGSYIFFQTSQPPSTNGGLWVKTNLTRYEMNPSIVASGEFTGQAWSFTIPDDSYRDIAIGGTLIYKNKGYYLYEDANQISGSGNYQHYLNLLSMNLSNGISTKVSAAVYRFSTNYSSLFRPTGMSGFNNLIFIACSTYWRVVDSSGTATQFNTYSYNSMCNANESNLVPCWYRYVDYSTNNEIYSLSLANITNKVVTNIGINTYPSICIGTDTDSKIAYAIQSNLDSDQTEYKVYAVNYSTNTGSLKKSTSLSTISGQGFINGLCYFFGNFYLYAYDPGSDTYTNLGLRAGTVSTANSYMRDSSGINWVGGQTISAFTLSGASGTGAGLRDDTVYIITGGTKNYATIVNGDNGSQQVPIAGVYTVVNGVLTKFDEAYVSTGGAWSKVVY